MMNSKRFNKVDKFCCWVHSYKQVNDFHFPFQGISEKKNKETPGVVVTSRFDVS